MSWNAMKNISLENFENFFQCFSLSALVLMKEYKPFLYTQLFFLQNFRKFHEMFRINSLSFINIKGVWKYIYFSHYFFLYEYKKNQQNWSVFHGDWYFMKNLAILKESWIFGRPKRPFCLNRRSAQMRHDMIWNFRLIIF